MKRTVMLIALLLGSILLVFTGCTREEAPGAKPATEENTEEMSESQKIQRQLYQDAAINEDLASYDITYYEPDSIQTVAAPVKESDEPFQIVDYGPVEELPPEVVYPSMYVVFSQPVVPLRQLGEPMRSSDIMSIDPPIQGTFRWYGTRLLSFDADEKALPQRRYTVSISDTARSLGGKELTGEKSFSFHTEYLSIRDFFTGTAEGDYSLDDVPLDEAKTIHIVFSHKVNLNVIKNYLSVEAGGRGYNFTIARPDDPENRLSEEIKERTAVLHVEGLFPEDTDVTVTVRKGARSEADFIGTPVNITRSFHTLRPFRFVDYDTCSWSFPRSRQGEANPVYLKFSHSVKAEDLTGKVRTNPAMEITEENVEVYRDRVRINNLPVAPESVYTLFLDAGITDVYGRKLQRSEQVRVEVPPAERYAYFPNTGPRMLEAAFPKRIMWEHQNVFEGLWKADTVSDPYGTFSHEELRPYNFGEIERNKRYFEVYNFKDYLNSEGYGWVGFSWNFGKRNNDGTMPTWTKRDLRLQVTDLGLTVRHGYNKIITLVTSLATGEAVEGAEVSITRKQAVKKSTETDADGLAVFELEEGEYFEYFGVPGRTYENELRIRVKYGNDKIEFKPNYSHDTWRSNIYNTAAPTQIGTPNMVTYLFTDRKLYKPGETVTFRGIDRNQQYGKYTPFSGGYDIAVRESRYRGREITRFRGETTGSGGLYGSFTLPEDAEPGWYEIAYSRDEKTVRELFQVAHFRRLLFSVDMSSPDITHYQGDTVSFTVASEYLAGGALSRGNYEVYWSKRPVTYTPPGDDWKDYRFGPEGYDSRHSLETAEGSLPPTGTINVKQKTSPEGIEGRAYVYEAEARISDVSNQLVAKREGVTVHPAAFYIGARVKDAAGSWYTFVEKGKEMECEVRLVTPEGGLVKDGEKISLTGELYKIEWKLAQQQGVYDTINSRWERVETKIADEEITLSSGKGTARFTPGESGSYYIKFTAEDAMERKAVTELSLYATGGGWVRWGSGDADMLELKPDKQLYKPGDTAKILLQSPIPEGDYLITVEREGIFNERKISVEGSAKLIEVPITEDYLPVVYVSVSSYTVRTGKPEHTYFEPDLDKPKGLYGVTPLRVETAAKLIDISIEPAAPAYLPGAEAEVVLTATQNGRPVENAELTFLAVDRGVLDLINYHITDPLAFFYSEGRFPLAVEGADSRSLLIDPVTYDVPDLAGGDGKDGEDEGGAGMGMKRREDFNPTAVFEPFLSTDEEGRVTVRFTLPDTLTTYRLTAVAVRDNSFGIQEKELKVQNPINVKTAFPRRLRYRDTAVGSVLLTNLDGKEHEVTLNIESDILGIGGKNSKTVAIPAASTLEVPFQLLAVSPGTAEITVTTKSEVLEEQLVETLIVEKPYIFETFATIGQAEDSAGEGIVLPSYVDDDEGSLTINLSGSRAASLGEAIDYVIGYPYGCMEQRASKLLPLVLLEDYVDDFALENPVGDIRGTVQADLDLWGAYQRSDGGFPFWPVREGVYSSYYATVRAGHLLALARDRGYTIPDGLSVPGLLDYLANPPSSARGNNYLMLYGLYVRSLLGAGVSGEAARYFARGDEIGISGYGFLGLIYLDQNQDNQAEQCLNRIKQFVRPGTRSVDLTETYESSSFYNSQVEQLALFLMLYSRIDPESDMVTRITNTLMDRQKGGIWKNTADTNWAIQAFTSLLQAEGGGGPDFAAEVTIDGETIAEAEIDSIAEIFNRKLPLSGSVLTGFDRDIMYPLTFTKEGAGRLYYTASLRYAIPSEISYPRDEGIGIVYEISTVDGQKVEGAALTVGKTYRLKAVVSSHRGRSYVAVRLPVPSGAEILDAAFVTTPKYDEFQDPDVDWSRYVPFGSKIFDNEVRYFWDEFPRGRQEVSFLFRTTSGGVFPTPPATAECMYEPEIFGRTGGRIFIIKRDEE